MLIDWETLDFTVPGAPVGKARPRVTRTGHAFTPEKTVSYENLVKMCFREAYPDWVPTEEPCKIALYVGYPVPKSASGKRKTLMLLDKIRPTKKPDVDNIMKIICDALNGIAWKDDSQIIEATIEKHYSMTPGVHVIITANMVEG